MLKHAVLLIFTTIEFSTIYSMPPLQNEPPNFEQRLYRLQMTEKQKIVDDIGNFQATLKATNDQQFEATRSAYNNTRVYRNPNESQPKQTTWAQFRQNEPVIAMPTINHNNNNFLRNQAITYNTTTNNPEFNKPYSATLAGMTTYNSEQQMMANRHQSLQSTQEFPQSNRVVQYGWQIPPQVSQNAFLASSAQPTNHGMNFQSNHSGVESAIQAQITTDTQSIFAISNKCRRRDFRGRCLS